MATPAFRHRSGTGARSEIAGAMRLCGTGIVPGQRGPGIRRRARRV